MSGVESGQAPLTRDTTTVAELLDRYIEDQVALLQPGTVRGYRDKARRLKASFGPVAAIPPQPGLGADDRSVAGRQLALLAHRLVCLLSRQTSSQSVDALPGHLSRPRRACWPSRHGLPDARWTVPPYLSHLSSPLWVGTR